MNDMFRNFLLKTVYGAIAGVVTMLGAAFTNYQPPADASKAELYIWGLVVGAVVGAVATVKRLMAGKTPQ